MYSSGGSGKASDGVRGEQSWQSVGPALGSSASGGGGYRWPGSVAGPAVGSAMKYISH